MKRFLCLALLLTAAGCRDDDPADGGASGAAGGAGAAIEPTPIMNRPPEISHTCTEERPMTEGSVSTFGGFAGLAEAGGEFFMTYATPPEVVKIRLDGSVVGDSLLLDANATRQPVMSVDGEDIVVVWTTLEEGEEQLL